MTEETISSSTDKPFADPSQAMPGSRKPPSRLRRLLMNRRLWAILVLLLGVWLMVFFGTRTLRAYREFEYAREQGLLNGTASVDAIQPWMTIRYIAVAYAVPEEYIYAKLDIPFDRRSEREPLGRLGRQRRDDGAPVDGAQRDEPADPKAGREEIVQQMRAVILAYRENPVAPGLRDIRPWMSLAYIANSTGVPLDYLEQALTDTAAMIRATEFADRPDATPPELRTVLESAETPHKPLDLLSEDLHYPGGPERLLDTIREALATYDAAPTQESSP